MRKIIIHIVVNAVAFYIAFSVMRDYGIHPQHMEWWGYLVLALIFGVINAFIRPIVTLLGCPFILLTLGLGILLVNTLIFYLAGLVGRQFGFGFTVDGFVPAFFGALIISLFGVIAHILAGDGRSNHRRK